MINDQKRKRSNTIWNVTLYISGILPVANLELSVTNALYGRPALYYALGTVKYLKNVCGTLH